MKPSGRPLLTVAQLAERLGTSPKHVYRMVHDQRVPYIKLGDGPKAPVRFDPADIDRWLTIRRVERQPLPVRLRAVGS